MDKQAAENLISNTFNRPFNESSFLNFVRNLLNDIDEAKAFSYLHGNYIRHSFADHVKQYRRIGAYTDPNGERIDVLIVHLKRGTALEHARTRQRNFIAWYLNGGRGGVLRDAALVAFASPDLDDWRFSYVRMEYKGEVADSGKVKVKKELAPAKRYSFLVGKNEPSHTAQQQLLPVLQKDSNNPTLSELENAFSVEAVTKQFYLDYKRLFEKLKTELNRILEADEKVKKEFEIKSIDTANFAKKLLGQIVFLYFLQKKGWMGVEKDEKGDLKHWGTGPKNFLRKLFEKQITQYGNFFDDVLEPLFYEALAIERSNNYYSRFNCKIPFLNGGLFEPINDYNWQETDIHINNNLFAEIFDTFDRYNFTVKEDEPLEKEVAVDPEMLGKVFENLLPENLRKGQGTYYTPREIVHYMCQESLINYLDTSVNTGEISLTQENQAQENLFSYPEPEQLSLKGAGYKTVIPRKDIEDFIRKGEFAIEHDIAKEEGTKTYEYQVSESIRKNARLLDEKLESIKICDPAIGSGAFPVGMMHEIVKARNVLETYLKTGKRFYNFKRHCIQESLYGVDIDPGAIEIAKLRLWLSLVVDEEDYLDINPLPNLDYKIMQGNSLIEDFHGVSLNFEKNDTLLFSENEELDKLIEDLYRKQGDFFNAVHHGDKNRLKGEVEDAIVEIFHHELKRQKEGYFRELEKIEEYTARIPKEETRKKFYESEKAKLDKKYDFDFEAVENELREMTHGNKMRNFFPWKLYFADVFRKNGGFDVVIANPPYLGFQGHKEEKSYLLDNYISAAGRFDIYLPFTEKAVKLGCAGAVGCYICPTNFMKREHGNKLRKYLLQQVTIVSIIDFGDFQIFQDALNYTGILLWKRQKPLTGVSITYKKGIIKADRLILKGYSYPQNALSEDIWIFRDQPTETLVEKIRRCKVETLEKLAFGISEGIVTGKNPVFLKSKEEAEQIGLEVEIVKDCLRGNNIRRYYIEPAEFVVIYPYCFENNRTRPLIEKEFKQRFPKTYEYLSSRKEDLAGREYFDRSGKLWYELWNQRDIQQLNSEKIIVPELAETNRFAIAMPNEFYIDTTCGITLRSDVNLNLRYIIGLLNSSLIEWIYKQTTVPKANSFYIYKTMFLKRVPIRMIDFKDSDDVNHYDRIISFADQILTLKKSDPQADTSALEAEIDQIVYKLYGLTTDEIELVENANKKGGTV